MQRLLYIAILTVISLISLWLLEHPMPVTMQINGYMVTTSVATLTLIIVALAVLLIMLSRFLSLPRSWKLKHENKRLQQSLDTAGATLLAMANNQYDTAGKHARKLEKLQHNKPLSLLLSAQAAQLQGDKRASLASFEQMLALPATQALGYRGLLVMADKAGDTALSDKITGQFAAVCPKDGMALEHQLHQHIHHHAWDDARNDITRLYKAGHFSKQLRDAWLQKIMLQTPEIHTKATYRLNPAFVPAALAHARQQQGKRQVEVLLNHWKKYGQQSALIAISLLTHVPVIEVYHLCRRHLKPHAHQADALYTLTQAALKANQLPVAEFYIEQLLGLEQTRKALQLKADLLSRQGRDSVTDWRDKAAIAPPDPTWTCQGCGHTTEEWSLICGNCNGIDTVIWGIAAPLSPPPSPAPLLPAAG